MILSDLSHNFHSCGNIRFAEQTFRAIFKSIKRTIVENLTRIDNQDSQTSFNRSFWAKAGAEAIFAAAWEVEYLIVGAHAVMFYTEPRYTKDLDLLDLERLE